MICLSFRVIKIFFVCVEFSLDYVKVKIKKIVNIYDKIYFRIDDFLIYNYIIVERVFFFFKFI